MKRITFILFTMLLSTSCLFSLTGFGESPIFEISDDTLPVTLSSFMAIPNVNNQTIAINWTTQSESSLIGYHIHRAENTELSTANIVTSSIISAHNTTISSDYSFQDSEVQAETTYYYWLQSIEYDGNNFYGPVSAKISDDNDVPTLPNTTELVAIYPNPFSGNISTNIDVRVKENETSNLSIYNLKGQLVKSDKLLAGDHTVVWNGLDNSGKRCSNGIYFVQMKSATYSKTSKVLLMK
jgi:hypothetical protein